MNPQQKSLLAHNIRRTLQELLNDIDGQPLKELRAEHSEVRLPKSLRNHLMDLHCDLSQFVPDDNQPNTTPHV